MKRLLIIIVSIMICYASHGQYKNVEKLPQKIRDSILVQIANKAIEEYSEGYLRPGAIPIIEDFGLAKKEILEIPLEYLNIRFFTVRYKGTEEEHDYYKFNQNYLVKAFIRSDSCKVVTIRYIDDNGWVTSYLDQEHLTKKRPIRKRRFVTVEERKEERKRHLPKTIIDTTTSEYWRKFDERTKFIRDSVKKENIRKVELRRKAFEEQQKTDSLKALKSIMSCHTSQEQYKNIEKLPQKLRDSILIEVANKAISKYSEGYLRSGAIPIIEDFGPAKEETLETRKEYLGIRFFTVSYRGTEEEHNYRWYNKEYLVKAYIRADSCKVVTIRYIDDKGWVTSYLDQEHLEKNIPIRKKRFVTIEEREEERKRHLPKTIIDTTTSEYWRKFDERTKFIRDSVKKENIRKVELRRKAFEEQQKADSLKALKSIIICHTSQGQYKNVEKLPEKLRDSILVEVANEAINKYSEGYLRPGAIPIIEDLGLLKKAILGIDESYLGTRFFAVYYKGTEEEHNYRWYNKEYLVKVFIRADNCKVVNIRYIDDADRTFSGLDEEKTQYFLRNYKKRFVTIEEREEERKRHLPKTIIDTTTSEYWRKFDERTKFIRDSVKKENIRKVELRRKAFEEQQKADSLKALESNQRGC